MDMRATPLVMLLMTTGLLAADSTLEQARILYRHTDYDQAIQLLLSQKDEEGNNNSAVIELLGQCYFMTGDYKKSTEYLEQAVAAEPGNSMYHAWLGRVYGRRAETSFALSAMGWASKSRNSLEKAAQLDPMNYE